MLYSEWSDYAMKVAITIWNNRVSPVLDTAGRILLVEFQNGMEIGREEHEINEVLPMHKIRKLKELGVNLIICGAVSNRVEMLIDSAGIGLIPWVSAGVEEVIEVFKNGNLDNTRFLMPGCRGRGRRCRRGWEVQRSGYSFNDSREPPGRFEKGRLGYQGRGGNLTERKKRLGKRTGKGGKR